MEKAEFGKVERHESGATFRATYTELDARVTEMFGMGLDALMMIAPVWLGGVMSAAGQPASAEDMRDVARIAAAIVQREPVSVTFAIGAEPFVLSGFLTNDAPESATPVPPPLEESTAPASTEIEAVASGSLPAELGREGHPYAAAAGAYAASTRTRGSRGASIGRSAKKKSAGRKPSTR